VSVVAWFLVCRHFLLLKVLGRVDGWPVDWLLLLLFIVRGLLLLKLEVIGRLAYRLGMGYHLLLLVRGSLEAGLLSIIGLPRLVVWDRFVSFFIYPTRQIVLAHRHVRCAGRLLEWFASVAAVSYEPTLPLICHHFTEVVLTVIHRLDLRPDWLGAGWGLLREPALLSELLGRHRLGEVCRQASLSPIEIALAILILFRPFVF
jgi:hypothetical protein